MSSLYFDCFAGISGNMILGTLVDLGVPIDFLQQELNKLNISGYKLHIERVIKAGIQATYLDVQVDNYDGHDHHCHEHEHEHEHEHQHGMSDQYRHLPDILRIINQSQLNEKIKADSIAVFNRLAQAEAKVHGVTVEQVHFHEVGAVDTIIDIVGTMICLDYLQVEKIFSSTLNVGSGFVKCSHGILPVPAPATAELLRNVPYYSKDVQKELVTPTGAALITYLADEFGSIPAGFISQQIGYGAGTWDLDIPNVLRAFWENSDKNITDGDLLVIESNIDDMSPQIMGYVTEKLLTAGVLDVWLTPIQMKKGRLAQKISILTEKNLKEKVTDILLTETTTIGLRYYNVCREVAERKIVEVKVTWGMARVKLAYYKGELRNITPEYEDCRVLAEAAQKPLKQVLQAVRQQALQEYK